MINTMTTQSEDQKTIYKRAGRKDMNGVSSEEEVDFTEEII